MLVDLNQNQKIAVENLDGPLLIIAGAGSGKTRTLVERIARIILEKRSYPHEIMAVTFTNKAATELKVRIIARVGKYGGGVLAGTFHSICSRILRDNSAKIGYRPNFVIYDSEDKYKVIKQMIKKNDLSPSYFPYKKISAIISSFKNKLIYPNEYKPAGADIFFDKIKDIYSDYQNELEKCNAMDFDDLLCKTVKLFEKNSDILFEYQNQIKYICVDEYQDTNFVQDRFVSLISGLYENICVVGDEDQSIYGWRGADINNILSFSKRHKNCKTIQLEENYRSSSHILSTANSVIKKNKERLGKNLFTRSGEGERVILTSCADDIEEGRVVADKIADLVGGGVYLNEICILYRTNSQSRVLEENLRRLGIPYSIIGGPKFYERKEIRDITAYLRLLVNKDDNIAFERIVNFPPRGIGKKTLQKIKYSAISLGVSYYEGLKRSEISQSESGLSKKIRQLTDLTERLTDSMEELDAYEISDIILKESGLLEYYTKKSEGDRESSKVDNLYEFLNGVSEYIRTESSPKLIDFLSSVSLLSDIDAYNDREDRIILMTVHCAKGLEFDNVFITGMNEGLFPFIRPGEDVNAEEERRLFYVALTRARKRIYISAYRDRNRYFGADSSFNPSRFLDDLPEGSTDRSSFEQMPEYRTSVHLYKKQFKKKDIVLSKQFGEGIILDIEDSDKKRVLTIDFDEFGIKKLIEKYADLKQI
ncbi:MAG: 3'-5' exonuclease [Candidatus Delongbacteria bacterium]